MTAITFQRIPSDKITYYVTQHCAYSIAGLVGGITESQLNTLQKALESTVLDWYETSLDETYKEEPVKNIPPTSLYISHTGKRIQYRNWMHLEDVNRTFYRISIDGYLLFLLTRSNRDITTSFKMESIDPSKGCGSDFLKFFEFRGDQWEEELACYVAWRIVNRIPTKNLPDV